MVSSSPGRLMTRDPLASCICRADSCTAGTGRPSALYSRSTLSRNSSPDCRSVGLSSKTRAPVWRKAARRARAAAVVLLPAWRQQSRSRRLREERSRAVCHGSGVSPARAIRRAGSWRICPSSGGGSGGRSAVSFSLSRIVSRNRADVAMASHLLDLAPQLRQLAGQIQLLDAGPAVAQQQLGGPVLGGGL